MQIPLHLKEKWVLVQDDETQVITYRLEEDKERDDSIYTKFNGNVKQVIKFPYFGMLAIDVTDDFQRRNSNGQFTTNETPLYPVDASRKAYAVYKMWYYDNCGRSAEPLPVFYTILPNDVVELAVESLQPEWLSQAVSIEGIDPIVIDKMKSDDKIFDPEDDTRSNLIIRFEADPTGPTPTDTTWHYDPCNLAQDTSWEIKDMLSSLDKWHAVHINDGKAIVYAEEDHSTIDNPQTLEDWIAKREYHKDEVARCSRKINSIKTMQRKKSK